MLLFIKLKKSFFIFSFFLTVLIFYFFINSINVPIIDGQKLGNIMLEKKIQKLIELDKSQGVDAVFLGASTVDFGVSVKTFNEEVTKSTGKKFTAFNFGLGGGDFFIWPDLVKLIKLYTKPKYYFLQATTGLTVDIEKISKKDSLYEKVRYSPVGSFLDSEILLMTMNKIWEWKFFSSMPSLRNKIVFNEYPKSSAWLYPLNEYGDSISYNYIYFTQTMEMIKKARNAFMNSIDPVSNAGLLGIDISKSESTEITLEMGRKSLVSQKIGSDSKIYIISFPGSAIESTFDKVNSIKLINRKNTIFFSELSKILNIESLTVEEDLDLKPWHVQDQTHYNTYAAEIIGKKLAEKFVSQKLENDTEPNIDALIDLKKESRMGNWTSIIKSPSKNENNVLKLKYMQNESIGKLPYWHAGIYLIIRLEKNKSNIFKTVRIENNLFKVDIPKNLLKQNAMYAIDLLDENHLTLQTPMESYSWEKK